jgi:beta-galactosidase
MVGVYPSLPSTVEAIYVDGALRSMPVKWDEFEKSQNNKCGIYRIKGRVTGERARAEAIITVYDAGGIESYSTVVPAGVAPALPATVRLVYNDGVDQFVPVAWDPVDPSAGQFTVSGRVAALKVQAHIRVTEDVTRDQNIARSDCPLKPAADASYSGTAKSIPAAMLDGINSSGGWSNYYYKDATALLPAFSKARPREWVKISWPNPQRLDNLRIYFTVNDSMSQPLTMKVSYWDGDSFVPVDNLSIAWAATSEEATTVTFNPVTTTQLRLDMISRFPDASNGFLEIRELEIPGDIVAYNTDAYLTDLKVNGQTIKEFDRNTTVYTVLTDGRIPEISAIAADNARIIIVPPLTIPGTAVITVTSEEGLTQRTYYINLDAGGTATSGALLTWFRDNFCENNISYGTLDREAEKIQAQMD